MTLIRTNVVGADPTTFPKISHTELYALTRCTKRHDYAYRQGLSRRTTPSYFSKGKFLHTLQETVLEAVMRGEDDIDLSYIEQASYLIQRDMMYDPDHPTTISEGDRTDLVTQVNAFYRDIDMTLVEVLGVEEEFYADVGLKDSAGTSVLLHGKMDARVKDLETGDVWLVEHKTASRRWSAGNFMFDTQGPLYVAVEAALSGEIPAGIFYNFFYKKEVEQLAITFEPERVETVLNEVQNALMLRESRHVMRQPHWGCNDCTFKDLCFAEMQGKDTSVLRETEYVVNEDKVERFSEGDE